jgi:putative acetyltransferase
VTSQWGTIGENDAPMTLFTPCDEDHFRQIRTLFTEYGDAVSVDLCFQNFAEELRTLPGEYSGPRGALLAVIVGNEFAGCCAMRALDTVDYANACELKRLYVRPAFRGRGLGRLLAEGILDAARLADYDCVLLDTLNDMESARALYEGLGFRQIPPYYFNPIPGAHYLKADL